MIKVAIVGSSKSHWTPSQVSLVKSKILSIFSLEGEYIIDDTPDGPMNERIGNILLISGGCPKGGVDIWAEEVANKEKIPKIIFKPDVEQWEDKQIVESTYPLVGYKSRNIQIAGNCDVIYCIDPKNRKGGGGLWTLEYAKNLGKRTYHIKIE